MKPPNECSACGICCDLYGFTLAAEAEDVERWQAEGRGDLLAMVGEDGLLWLNPSTGEHLDHCPHLGRVKNGGSLRALCSIHDTKPLICRGYPTELHGRKCVGGCTFIP
ncbi:MAG: hypothetical protein C0609_10255 [Deltaproteobacteria bacterium]|nr:MAG: hypothetical protein C0609_10255 [Deltaproteobacteria bacterium]